MVNIPNSNKKAQVIITSLAHKQTIEFFPYDFDIDDSYKPQWGEYEGFGRMDPIMIYKRTTRDVNLSFNVVAESAGMAIKNFNNLQTLIKCLYPTYQSIDTTSAVELEQKIKSLLQKQSELEEQAAASDAEEGTVVGTDDSDSISIPIGSAIEAAMEANEQEIQRAEAQITQETQVMNDFGIQVIHKSPLFQVSFMNLLNKQDFVAAITGFKHKMKFDTADTSFSRDGKAIPGEFNINISFKVLHNFTPGTKSNYGF
jgi:hypothetical protein